MEADEAPADGFSRFINVSTPVLENNSSCHWMSIALEDHGHVWISEHEKKYFEIFIYSNRRYVKIGDNAIRVEFPTDFFIPDKWFFFCFTYNNVDKKLGVYLNSEKIFDQAIEKHLDSFLIDKDFLHHYEF